MGDLNQLAVVLAIVIGVGAIITFVFSLSWKTKKKIYILSDKEIQQYRAESISIQAFNSAIFEDDSLHQVITEGGTLISNDGYHLLQGVNTSV